MADFVFDFGRGVFAEKVNDGAANVGVMLLKTAEADATLKTRTTLTDILAHNTEADFTNYARKTGLTATVTVDTSAHTVKISIPSQTWTAAGGGTNNVLAKAVVYYQDSAADSGRIPMVGLDFVITTDGSDVLLTVGTNGIYQAS